MASLRKRVRSDSADSELNSAEVKRLREDLLDLLDDSDPSDDSAHGLDFFMKSLQDEISAPVTEIVDLTSDSGESRPDLGYLLEASDDDLGLPPSRSSGEEEYKDEAELVRVELESAGVGGFWGFEDSVPSYGSYDLGMGESFSNGNEFVGFDGLFGYSEVYFDSSDYSDLSWRSETLPGL